MEFIVDGFKKLKELDGNKCLKVLEQIKNTREWGPSLFLPEEDFKKQEHRYGTNPRQGRNVLEKIDQDLLKSLEGEFLVQLVDYLGSEPEYLMAKAVCGVPDSWLPDYVRKEIELVPAANLGIFIKPEYRDITYFRGIDYHQDIIDYKDRIGDFVTVYIYLDEVDNSKAPLKILPKTHNFGADIFPHNLEIVSKDHENKKIKFTHKDGRSVISDEITILGKEGTCYFWNAYLLHGTCPTQSLEPRISLRYLVNPKRFIIHKALDHIDGKINLSTTRVDVDEKHVPIIKQNFIKETN